MIGIDSLKSTVVVLAISVLVIGFVGYKSYTKGYDNGVRDQIIVQQELNEQVKKQIEQEQKKVDEQRKEMNLQLVQDRLNLMNDKLKQSQESLEIEDMVNKYESEKSKTMGQGNTDSPVSYNCFDNDWLFIYNTSLPSPRN